MIVKLTTELALFTTWSSEHEHFQRETVREASRAEAEWALNSIPRNEISSSPDGFRNLAIALMGTAWIGELAASAVEVASA